MKKFIGLALAALFLATLSATAGAVKIAWYAPVVHPFWEAVRKGVERFEREHKVEVLKQVGQEMTQDSENANVEAMAARGYKGFSIFPADPNAANGLYRELAENGITVVNYGAPTALPTPAAFTVGTDIPESARLGAEKLAEILNYEGNVVNVLELLSDANTMVRKKMIAETLAKYPKIKIIQEIGDINSVEEGIEKIQNAIAGKINEVNGILCTGYSTTIAATTLLKDINAPGNIKLHLVGIDDDPIVLPAIRDGYIGTTLAQNPDCHGYLSCVLLKHLLEGAKPKKDGHVLIPAGQVFVTPANVETYLQDLTKVTKAAEDKLFTDYLTK